MTAAGEDADRAAPSAERVREALRGVVDPEVGLDVVAMGLVYGVAVEGARVRVRHTLTTPGCPMGDVLRRGIEEAVRSLAGVEEVETELVWEPRWHAGMIDGRAWDDDEE